MVWNHGKNLSAFSVMGQSHYEGGWEDPMRTRKLLFWSPVTNNGCLGRPVGGGYVFSFIGKNPGMPKSVLDMDGDTA